MAWWVYKCNARYGVKQGDNDWDSVFDSDTEYEWGSTAGVRYQANLSQVRPGDFILAYQTDRNELVGVANAIRWKRHGDDERLIVRPNFPVIRKKMRPLRESDSRICRLSAFNQQGNARTIFSIPTNDAVYLLAKCGFPFRNGILDSDGGHDREKKYLEGEKRSVASWVWNTALRFAAKNRWGTACYCCGFDFGEFYGRFARGYAIVHHLRPFTNSNGKLRSSSVDDVRVVCANCHCAIHLEDPPIEVNTLRRILKQRSKRPSVRSRQ